MDAGNILAVEKAMNELGFMTNYQQGSPPLATNYQTGLTNFQLGQQPVSSSQILVTSSQNPVALSGQACQAKQELEILVATGKTKDLLNKQLT